MGFFYSNILNWITLEVAQVSCDPEEQFAWLLLVQEAVEEVLGKLGGAAVEKALGLSPNSVLVDSG